MLQCSGTGSCTGRTDGPAPSTQYLTRTIPSDTAACSLGNSRENSRENEPLDVPALELEEPKRWLEQHRFTALHTLELSTVWDQLCARKLRCLASFFTDRECCAVLELAPDGKTFGDPMAPQALEVLQKTLFEHNQKAVAMEFRRSASAISTTLRRTLRTFGFDCTGRKLPVFIVMAAHAGRVRSANAPRARATRILVAGRQCELVLVQRPDRDFAGVLSRAESAVTRLVVEGFSHAHIARARGTSRRTVANQLATSFRKLQVSGRIHMLTHLVDKARGAGSNAH